MTFHIKTGLWKVNDVVLLNNRHLAFSAFLAGYGFSRFKYQEKWPVPEDVFTHLFLEGNHPLLLLHVWQHLF